MYITTGEKEFGVDCTPKWSGGVGVKRVGYPNHGILDREDVVFIGQEAVIIDQQAQVFESGNSQVFQCQLHCN